MNLVTGATGFLGSHIAERLVQNGQPVRALVIFRIPSFPLVLSLRRTYAYAKSD